MVHIDVGVFYDVHKRPYSCFILVDVATGFAVPVPLRGLGDKKPSAKIIKRAYVEGWTTWARQPPNMTADQDSAFRAEFTEALEKGKTLLVPVAKGAHHQLGFAERKIGVIRGQMQTIVHDLDIDNEDRMFEAIIEICAASNRMMRTGGYSPTQWVFGEDIEIPGHLLDREQETNLNANDEVLQNPGGEFARLVKLRELAATTFIQAMSSEKARRTVLAGVTRRPIYIYKRGDVVYYWRGEGLYKSKRFAGASRWLGPARLIGRDVHGWWCIHRGYPVLVNEAQLRRASDQEVRAWRWTHGDDAFVQGSKQRGYEDMRAPPPPDDAYDEPIGPEARRDSTADTEEREDATASGGNVDMEDEFEQATGAGASAAPPESGGVGADQSEQPAPEALPAEEPEMQQTTEEAQTPQEEDPVTENVDAAQVPVGGAEEDFDLDEREPEISPLLGPEVEPGVIPEPADAGATEATEVVPGDAGNATQATAFTPLRRRMNGRRPIQRPYLAERKGKIEGLLHDVWIQECLADGRTNSSASKPKYNAKRKSEIHRRDCTEEEWKLFEESLLKEWKQWLDLGACDILSEKASTEVDPKDVIGQRPVHTDKNKLLRGKPGNEKLPVKAKTRLVVRGDQEKQKAQVRTDSPTATSLAAHVICQCSASFRWRLNSLDAVNAYFQGEKLVRDQYIRPCPELVRLVPELKGRLLKSVKSIYGSIDASRQWWKRISGVFLSGGAKLSLLEPAMFWLYHEDGTLAGAFQVHVDDVLYAHDDSERSQKFTEHIKTAIQWGDEKSAMTDEGLVYCGRRFRQQENFDVDIDMELYCNNLKIAPMGRSRRSEDTSKLRPDEWHQLRGNGGQAQWVSRMGLPEVAFKTSKLASSYTNPVVEDLKASNAILRTAKKLGGRKIHFPHELDLNNVCVLSAQDASFDNLKDSGSQQGKYLFMADKGILAVSDEMFPCSVAEWNSNRIRRVVRSTLAAEAYSMGDAVDSVEHLRTFLAEGLCPGFDKKNREEYAEMIDAAVVTDARSLYEAVVKEGTGVKDKRVRLEVNLIKQTKNLKVRWTRSEQMVADHLTKEVSGEIENYAHQVRESARWTLGFDPRAPASTRKRDLAPPEIDPEESLTALQRDVRASTLGALEAAEFREGGVSKDSSGSKVGLRDDSAKDR